MGGDEARLLLDLARRSIEHGLRCGRPPAVDLDGLPAVLCAPGACFVTLEKSGRLRGCRGMLSAQRPLAEDVVINAFDTAFADPRFPPVTADELDQLDISLSILEPPTPLDVAGFAELLAQLRPQIDGLIIDDGIHRATFLPSVWEQLPEPRAFVDHLWLKAGLTAGHWPDKLRVLRYGAEKISEP